MSNFENLTYLVGSSHFPVHHATSSYWDRKPKFLPILVSLYRPIPASIWDRWHLARSEVHRTSQVQRTRHCWLFYTATRFTYRAEYDMGGFYKLAEPIISRAVNRQAKADLETLKDILEA